MEAFGFDKSLKKDRILGFVSAPLESHEDVEEEEQQRK